MFALDAKRLVQSRSAAEAKQRAAAVSPSAERLALSGCQRQVPGQHHDAWRSVEQFLQAGRGPRLEE